MRSGILPGHRDESVRPQDDLFRHANGTWVAQTEIPGDRGRYGTFDMLREYLRHLGLSPFEEDFYLPEGTPAWLVEKKGPVSPKDKEYTLAQVREDF